MRRITCWMAATGVLLLAGCKSESKDAEPKQPATPAVKAAPPAVAADACADAVAHVAKLGAAAGVDVDVAADTAACKAEQWPAAFLSCAVAATELAAYADQCTKLLFPPDTRLEIKRRFDSRADNSAVTPAAGTQSGDFVVYNRDQDCGFLWIHRKPAEAGYVLCGETLLAGPLTTVAEIEEVFAEFARQSKEAHDLQMELMKKWPTGRTVEVYDEVGNYVGEKVE